MRSVQMTIVSILDSCEDSGYKLYTRKFGFQKSYFPNKEFTQAVKREVDSIITSFLKRDLGN